MAVGREVMRQWLKRGWLIALLAFLLPAVAQAETGGRPIITGSDWRTGEIQVCYENVIPGNIVFLYTTKWTEEPTYTAHDFWEAQSSSECHISQYFENGQSVWFYIKQMDPITMQFSNSSNMMKQTPPITAFIINWPDMFNDLANKMKELNDDLKDHLDGLATPSDDAINDLKNAIDGLKDAVGAGQASGVGGGLKNGLDGLQGGMKPPIGVDDGNGTFTGGSTGGQMPFNPGQNSGGGLNLNAPDPDSGTSNDLTMRIPIGINLDGSLYYIKILTDEQLEKMKWLNLARNIAGAIIFILFGMWLVYRFAPQLKS